MKFIKIAIAVLCTIPMMPVQARAQAEQFNIFTSNAYYWIVNPGHPEVGKVVGQITVIDWNNSFISAYRDAVKTYAVQQGLQAGGSLAQKRSAFLQGINDGFHVMNIDMDKWRAALIQNQPGGNVYKIADVADEVDLANGGQGIACSESSMFAQTIIEDVGAQFGIIKSSLVPLNLSGTAFELVTGHVQQAGENGGHVAINYEALDPVTGQFINKVFNASPTSPGAIEMDWSIQGLYEMPATLRIAQFNSAGQVVDLGGNTIDASPGTIGEAIQSAAEETGAQINAQLAGESPVQLALDFGTTAGKVTAADAGEAMKAVGSNFLQYAAQEADPILFNYAWGDWAALAGDVANAVNIPMLIAETMNNLVTQVNTSLISKGERFSTYADLQGMCNATPTCAASQYGVQIATAIGYIFQQPVIDEVFGSVPNLLYHPEAVIPGTSQIFIKVRTNNPQGYPPCLAASVACFVEAGGFSISQLADGTVVETDRYGITETYTPTGIVLPHDFQDGNGPTNYPVYKLTLDVGFGPIADGVVSVPTGHIYAGGVATYLSSVDATNVAGHLVSDQSVTVIATAGPLTVDTIPMPDDSLIASVDVPTYEQFVGSLPNFSYSAPSNQLGVESSVNASPVYSSSTSNGSQDTRPSTQVTVTCSNVGTCSNSLGQSWVLSSPTYYASNGASFSYLATGAACAINYMSGCFNNNPMGGFGGVGIGGGITISGPASGGGGYYNPCGNDGEFDPACWAY